MKINDDKIKRSTRTNAYLERYKMVLVRKRRVRFV
jgi:hypothetical protein